MIAGVSLSDAPPESLRREGRPRLEPVLGPAVIERLAGAFDATIERLTRERRPDKVQCGGDGDARLLDIAASLPGPR